MTRPDPPSWPTGVSELRPQPNLRAVVSGVGSVRGRLGRALTSAGARRPLVVCGANLATSPTLTAVLEALGPLRATSVVYAGSSPHTPRATVDAGAAAARAHDADAVVAVGGSSAIDCAKGIARLLTSGVERVADLEPVDFARLGATTALTSDRPPLPFVSVTTTLSFAEFQPFWGARDEATGRKLPYADGAIVRTVFLDGEAAATTPWRVWAETGVKALDDALFTYLRSGAPEPFLDPVLESAITALVHWLPPSCDAGASTVAEARQQALTATWMTKAQLPRLAPPALPAWFSTAARHSLGSVYGIAHGAASAIALPVGLEHHAAFTHERQQRLAALLGWPVAPGDHAPLGPGVGALLQRLALPTSLAGLGLDAGDLGPLVDAIVHEAPALGRDAVTTLAERLR